MHYSSQQLQKHLELEHKISPFSTYLKEIIYGGNDGIVTTFAVVAGFAGAQSGVQANYTYLTVLLFGFANLCADATSMGLGNFLSLRSEKDVYKNEKAKERHEVEHNPEGEKAETYELLLQKGFTPSQATQLVEIYASNPTYWVDFMMNYELQLPNPEGENPLLTGLATFISFIIFGSVPLLPYIFFPTSLYTFSYAVLFTLFALALLGFLRWRVTKESLIRSIGEIMLIGSVSAFIAYIVGTLFRI